MHDEAESLRLMAQDFKLRPLDTIDGVESLTPLQRFDKLWDSLEGHMIARVDGSDYAPDRTVTTPSGGAYTVRVDRILSTFRDGTRWIQASWVEQARDKVPLHQGEDCDENKLHTEDDIRRLTELEWTIQAYLSAED